jgi:hypothetical protein
VTPQALVRANELDRRIKLLAGVIASGPDECTPTWPGVELSPAGAEVVGMAIMADLQAQLDAAQAELRAL